MFAGQPSEDAIIGLRDGDVQLLDTDVQCCLAMDYVPLVLGHLRATGLAPIVWSEAVAFQEVPQRYVVVSVVQHLDYTAGE